MSLLKQKRIWTVLLVPFCLLLSELANRYPAEVETVYSRGIYPATAGIFGRLFSLFPFSVFEILALLLLVFFPIALRRLIRRLRRDPAGRWEYLAGVTSGVLCAASVFYALFTLLCGIGYCRMSFAEQCGLVVRDSSPQELAELGRHLVETANALREQVAESPETGTMALSFGSVYQAGKFAGEAYQGLGRLYPAAGGYTPRAKPVLFSKLMSYMDMAGIYIPFTFEANVNVDIPAYSIPSAMMHELSHFHGFMREEEANFLAYAACRESGNTDFEYSGAMLALIHTTNALYTADRDAYWEVAALLSPAVRADLEENSAYWKRFKSPVSAAAEKVNDVYLKTNRQAAGVNSYGRMVDLLLADFRAQQRD